MDSHDLIQTLATWALPVLFAITLHEVAHGWVARSLGDPTAFRLGRLSLNPLRHVDPIGTVLIPGMLLLFGSFLFGWAKPVPVDSRNFKDPRKDMAIVAIAGPLSNLAMAIVWAFLFKYAAETGATEGTWFGVREMAKAGIAINLGLMVLNLLPLPPLDGGRVVVGLLPAREAHQFARIEPYGMVILLILVFTHVLGAILQWPLALAYAGIGALIGSQ